MTHFAQILFVGENHIAGFVLVPRGDSAVSRRDQPQHAVTVHRHELGVARVLQHGRDPPAPSVGAHHASSLASHTAQHAYLFYLFLSFFSLVIIFFALLLLSLQDGRSVCEPLQIYLQPFN